MFLFTTPASRETAPASPVVDAIRQGAERTGVGFDYLLTTAQRESSLNPQAKAPTSSATGLFQFIEQTWLGLMKAEGPKLGLAAQAGAIATRADGVHTVADSGARRQILALREDPQVASVMAGALTQKNREQILSEIGREPSQGELYVAHFLGARGASELIKAAQANPTRAAASDFPDAAAANRSIFYDRQGRARGAGEVYALLTAGHAQSATAAPAFAPDKPVAFAKSDGPAFHGMFQSGGRQGPISEAVAKLWRVGEGPRTRTAALSFFPRSDGAADSAPREAEPAVAAAPSAAPNTPSAAEAGVPLPPPRPPELGGPAPRRATQGPLDLTRFMAWRRP